jgi:hypothetical protein
MLPLPPLGHIPIAINPDKVEIYPEKKGGQGDAPLGLLPPLGERGGHSASSRREQTNRDKEDFNRAKKLLKNYPSFATLSYTRVI